MIRWRLAELLQQPSAHLLKKRARQRDGACRIRRATIEGGRPTAVDLFGLELLESRRNGSVGRRTDRMRGNGVNGAAGHRAGARQAVSVVLEMGVELLHPGLLRRLVHSGGMQASRKRKNRDREERMRLSRSSRSRLHQSSFLSMCCKMSSLSDRKPQSSTLPAS